MLRHLVIRRFAIISDLDIDVSPGFTAITGETGAGKSILVDALGLLLGDRADSGLIAADSEQAELEAVFALEQDAPARNWLEAQALAEGDELIVRRVLTKPSGSRAWINGRHATVGQLAELGSLLVEIHGQHEHQQLEKPATQRRLLDRQLDPEKVDAVTTAYARWFEARESLAAFEADAGDADQLELLQFQCRELNELDLAEGEYDKLEQEQEKLSRSDDIRLAAAAAGAALDSEDGRGARSLLHEAMTALSRVQKLEPRLDEAARMLEEARIDVDEAMASLERVGDEETGDPERLAQVNQRLQTSLDLARKHRVQPTELHRLTAELNERLASLENQGQRRRELEAALEKAESDWRRAADALSKARSKAAESLAQSVRRRLAELGMDQAELAFRVGPDPEADPARHGHDRITIEFSANPGQPPQPLARVASGGELSRVALALMIATGAGEGPATRIFDEVDAGVGGETAHVVGRFLREAAGTGQALCVTHLAQVAACADHQLRVVKDARGDTTTMRADGLDADERKREIARMLGSADSQKSLAHAAEMLEKGIT